MKPSFVPQQGTSYPFLEYKVQLQTKKTLTMAGIKRL